MTTTIKNDSYTNGWNTVVDALEQGKDISAFEAKIKVVQTSYSPSHGLFHYAEGVKDCLAKYEKPGIKIPDKI